ncbi:MAG: hypothetical protein MZW92_64945 [Comamonadaceae bacterium]|nr:hypothetical protein [Comamonadaceae bacterium]
MAAANANIPTEMAMKLVKEWNARGYGLDVVLYKKYAGSTYVDPHEEEKVAFKDLPNRFPSVLSRDFRKEQGQYEDFDNLFAMYLLYNLGKYSVRVNDETKRLEIEKSKDPMAYTEAAELATQSAKVGQPRLSAAPAVPPERDGDRGTHGQHAPLRFRGGGRKEVAVGCARAHPALSREGGAGRTLRLVGRGSRSRAPRCGRSRFAPAVRRVRPHRHIASRAFFCAS